MKFVLISYDMYGASIALKMRQEGHDVIVGQIYNKEDILLDEELQRYNPEGAKEREKRLSLFDGLLKKVNVWKLLKFLQTQKPSKDWYIFMDMNYAWKFGDQLLKSGFQGNFPTKWDRTLEVSRERAKEFVKQYYPDVKIADYRLFHRIGEGIAFLKTAHVPYVLKSQGDEGETLVPQDDVNIAQEQIINQLKIQQKQYEHHGFMLEEKIISPIELTPEMVFWNGKPVYSTLDIENKKLGCGNVGPNTGCAQNLIIKTSTASAINKIAFPPIVYETAKRRPGYFVWDISLLFDQKGTPYMGEFCPNRPGWDALPAEVAMSGDKKIATPYFSKIIKGENPLIHSFGSAVRMFNVSAEKIESGIRMAWDAGADPDIYLYDAKKQGKDVVTTGYAWDTAVVTGIGKTPEQSIKKCYEYVDMFHMQDKYYRTQEDFLSISYRTSILNRYSWAKNMKLI